MYTEVSEQNSKNARNKPRLCAAIRRRLSLLCRASEIHAAILTERRVLRVLKATVMAEFFTVSDRYAAMDTHSGKVIDLLSAISTIHNDIPLLCKFYANRVISLTIHTATNADVSTVTVILFARRLLKGESSVASVQYRIGRVQKSGW